MTPAAVSECVVYDWAERLERNWFRGAYSAGEHTDAPKLLGSFAYCTLRPVGTATASRAGHFCKMCTVAGGTQRCVLDGLQRNANHSQITPRAQAGSEPLQNALGTLFDMFLKVCKGSNCNHKRMQTDDTAAATHTQQSRLRCCFGLAVLIRRSSKSTI